MFDCRLVQAHIRSVMASSGVTQTIESLFGPPSELFNVEAFLKDATQNNLASSTSISQPEPYGVSLGQEYSAADIKDELERVLDDPQFSAQLLKDHESAISALYSNFAKNKKPGRKTHFPEPETLPSEVVALRKDMDEINLKSWKLHPESVMFIRPPRNSDYNSLVQIVSSGSK
ncbi:hypothetical protein EST38_g2864 [Candolleomyces aberdarensis]|uniref:Uncharacterized protein n=1 Tax=Candolleomyces aberdarensis TaxID=2316362 RepID=A0A4Q2DV23_9AGAR|nr:hypothetical protein EST38_g2864 [Candolleomyces aberdarensis]